MDSDKIMRATIGHNKQLKRKGKNSAGEQSKSKKVKISKDDSSKQVISSADKLKWKPVEIPHTLGDYEGFYGLEEIDAVDVEIINGQTHFITADKSKVLDKEHVKAQEDIIPEGDFEVDLSDDDKTLWEHEDAEETAGKKNKNDANHSGKTPMIVEGDGKIKTVDKKQNKMHEVKSNPDSVGSKLDDKVFSEVNSEILSDLPKDNVDLPEWKDVPLSLFSQNALLHLDFKQPTDIQKACIPSALEGKDIIGKAMTGSGKTLAYGIPILEKALKQDKAGVQHPTGVIFAPTRELATQVTKHLSCFVRDFPLSEHSIVSLTGGLSIQKQERLLKSNPRVLVCTAGRCLELIEKSDSVAKQLASSDIMVYDEADRLVEDGHFDELEKVLEILRAQRPKDDPLIPKKWQTLVFSATLSKDLFGKLNKAKSMAQRRRTHSGKLDPYEEERMEVMHLLGWKLRFRGEPLYVDVNPKSMLATKITEALLPCTPLERDLMLYYFLSLFPGNTLVFANSIDAVKRLKPLLNYLHIPAVALHSSMIQRQRLKSLERFEQNCKQAAKGHKASVLIASDVAARGLDIPNIQHVVHYHLPRTADTYIHRSGRTARAGKEGVSIILCSPKEASGPLHKLRKIVSSKKNAGSVAELKLFPVDSDILKQLKSRIEIAAKLAQGDVADSSLNKEKNWVEKAAEDLGVEDWDDVGEDDFLKRDRKRKTGKHLNKRSKKILKAELKELLANPVKKGRASYITSGLNSIADMLLRSDGKSNNGVMSYLQKDALSVLNGKSKTFKTTRRRN